MTETLPPPEAAQAFEQQRAQGWRARVVSFYETVLSTTERGVDKLPAWVPFLHPLEQTIKSQTDLARFSIALGSGIDPQTGVQATTYRQRMTTAGAYLAESLAHQTEAALTILITKGMGGATEATKESIMDYFKTETETKVGSLLTNAPEVLRSLQDKVPASAKRLFSAGIQLVERVANDKDGVESFTKTFTNRVVGILFGQRPTPQATG